MAGSDGAQTTRLRLSGSARRVRWVAGSVAAMAIGALLVSLAVAQMGARSGYVAATRDLPAGHVVAAEDLMIVELAGADQLSAVPADGLSAAVGQTVLSPVAERALLTGDHLGAAEEHPADGEAVVGASLAPEQYPASLAEGAAVSVVVTDAPASSSGGDGESEPPKSGTPSGAGSAVPARVQRLTPPGEGAGESARVELVVDSADAADVAAAAAAGSVSLVAVSGATP
ncbi:SAF domain-containing protein [Nocardiopsis coralliicola]